MNRISQSAASLKLVSDLEPEIEWSDYPHIEPGVYPAYCKFAKIYFDHNFKRWTCLLRFEVRSNDLLRVIAPRVPLWLNLGSNEKPRASRRSRYFKEWILANGGIAPVRHDRLSRCVFVHRMAHVEIGDTRGPASYSVVRKIVSWDTGIPSSGSRSQQVTQSSKARFKGKQNESVRKI